MAISLERRKWGGRFYVIVNGDVTGSSKHSESIGVQLHRQRHWIQNMHMLCYSADDAKMSPCQQDHGYLVTHFI